MGSKLRAGMVAALLLLVGSVTVASATSSVDSGFRSDERKGSSGSDGHKTVILHLRAEANRPTTYVDLGEPELSEGDQFVFANDLFRWEDEDVRRRYPRLDGREACTGRSRAPPCSPALVTRPC